MENTLKRLTCIFSWFKPLWSDFRANFSTDLCLGLLANFVLSYLDKGIRTSIILIDLQKVLNTLQHKILFKKMKCLGFKLENISDQIKKSKKVKKKIIYYLIWAINVFDRLISQSISESRPYLHDDVMCISYQDRTIYKVEYVLTTKFSTLNAKKLKYLLKLKLT